MVDGRDGVLLISVSFPPQTSGAATILGNLVGHARKTRVAVLTREPYPGEAGTDPTPIPDCRRVGVRPWGWVIAACMRIFRWRIRTVEYLLIPILVWKGLRLLRRERLGRVVAAVNAAGAFLTAAWLIARLARRPLVLYGIDLWTEGGGEGERRMGTLLEERIVRSAATFFVISDSLRAHYTEKYPDLPSPEVVPIPLPPDATFPDGVCPVDRPVTILFTGLVYDACADALARLVEATAGMDDVRLLLCTPSSEAELAALGIAGPHVEARYASREEVRRLQREADLLFLPLAFSPSRPDVVATLFPTKTVEYLVSGVPILLHAPPGYGITRYAKAHGLGHIVDRPDGEGLAAAIRMLLEDDAVRRACVAGALRTARRHDGGEAVRRLLTPLRRSP